MPPHMNWPEFHASPPMAFTDVPGLQEGAVDDFEHSMGIEEVRLKVCISAGCSVFKGICVVSEVDVNRPNFTSAISGSVLASN